MQEQEDERGQDLGTELQQELRIAGTIPAFLDGNALPVFPQGSPN